MANVTFRGEVEGRPFACTFLFMDDTLTFISADGLDGASRSKATLTPWRWIAEESQFMEYYSERKAERMFDDRHKKKAKINGET
jgi:hypothetical protein